MQISDDPSTTPAHGFQLPQCPRCGDVQERAQYRKRHEGFHTLLECPACGVQFRPTDRTTVVGELLDVVASTHDGDHADRLVRHLLRYEQGRRELVGLPPGATRALYLATGAGVLYAVAVDRHGVAETVSETLVRDVDDATEWVATAGRDLVWTHPRYGRRGEGRP